MSAESRRVTKTEVWVGWENQVINGLYPLRRYLGGSNHSAVFLTEYRAESVPNAAIKLMPADALETEAQLVQWGTAATLTHPHLLRIFDVGRFQVGGRGFLYVVMEYADQTLAQILPRRALSPDETREMVVPALSALAFLHRNNLVQGQVKPTNLLVVGDQLKLASDTIRSAGNLSGGILRATMYDPPELKDGEIVPAGDIWGLGITLVEALTQHPPAWPDPKTETVALAVGLPPLFVDTVRGCLNQTPANRPTAAELEARYNPAVHAHPITVVAAEEPEYEVTDVAPPPPKPPAPSGRGVLVPAISCVLVIALAVWVSRTIFVARAGLSPGAGRHAAVRPSHAPLPADSGTGQAAVISRVNESARESGAQADPAAEPREVQSLRAAHQLTGGEASEGVTAAERAPSQGSATAGANVAALAAPATAAATAPAAATPIARVAAAATVAAASPAVTTAAATYPAPPADQGAPAAPEILGSVLHQQLPEVPRSIRERIRGHVNVTVRVLVDAAGNVVGEFFESAGPSRYFARMAGDAAGDWKFVPTSERGSRVWLLRFEFTRANVTVRMVGTN
jgi:hypothetical protein